MTHDEIQAAITKGVTCMTDGEVAAWLRALEELIWQRDEARREVCALEADTTEDQREYAKQRGWNCFEITMCKEAQHDLEADTHPG
jgi:hypothetical protein